MASLRQRLRAAIGGLPGLFWVLWGGLLVNRAASFVAALLAVYLVRERGFGAAAAGPVVSLWGAGFVVAGPLGGLLADRVGRRPTMLLGLLSGACAVGALVVAFTLSPVLAGQAMSRLGGRALWLACLAIALAVAVGYLATGAERRRRVAEARRSADPAVSPAG